MCQHMLDVITYRRGCRMDQDELRRKKLRGPYFEITLDGNYNIYDKLPYIRDINLCSKDSIRRSSGNIIKFYQYSESGIKAIENL